MQITQKLCRNYAKFTQNLAKIMHIIHHEINNVNCAKYPKMMQITLSENNHAIITQKLRIVLGNALFFQNYAKITRITQITQKLRKLQ